MYPARQGETPLVRQSEAAAVVANQPEGRVDDAEAWAAEGWPVIVDQSAVIGLTPVGAGHAGATWLLTGTHGVLVADAV